MGFKLDLKQKLTAQISRLVAAPTRTACVEQHDKIHHQELYESIALGNALAEIEDDANRQWR
jgi:hypothetical protein